MTLVKNSPIQTPRVALLILLGLPWTRSALQAQGAILFSNHETLPAINNPVTDSRNGQRLEGSAWVAQLYYAKGTAPETAITLRAEPSTSFQTGNSAGYVFRVVVTLDQVPPGDRATVQMRVWNVEAGGTYEQAAANPLGVIGKSDLVYLTVGGGDILPPSLVGLQDFSVYPVPEPGPLVIILAGLLAMGLPRLSRRR